MQRLLTILLLSLLLTTGCDQSDTPTPSLSVSDALSGEADPAYRRVTAPRPFDFPGDHASHPEYATEWWYFTGNLASNKGRRFGYQLTLFRIGIDATPSISKSRWRTGDLVMAHVAISDIDGQQHHHAERIARAGAGLAGASTERLETWIGPIAIRSQGTPWPVLLEADTTDLGISLVLEAPLKPVLLQGDEGFSRKGNAEGNASYYYSLTRIPTSGTLRTGKVTETVTGLSWMDREWSTSVLEPDQAGWDWFSLQLDDGQDLMFYRLRNRDGTSHAMSAGSLQAVDGNKLHLGTGAVGLKPLRWWTSKQGEAYPVEWALQLPDQGIDLQVSAAFDDQLMETAVRYWEGSVRVSGSHSGVGYMELSGYARTSSEE